MKRIILDTDIGIDDALALILALKSDELRLEAVTTVSGNVSVKQCTRNALKMLELMGREEIPVAEGASKPLMRELHIAEFVHGRDGLGDSNFPEPKNEAVNKEAADLIIGKVARDPGDIILVPIGPLTNIAHAIKREPDFVNWVKEIVLMGGAYGVTPHGIGNATPGAEYNIYTDPEAAKIVFESKAKITAIGLDVTTDPKAMLTQNGFVKLLNAQTREAEIIVRIMEKRMKARRPIAVHDAMAVAYLIWPDLFKVKKYRVDVETIGEFTTGQTVTDKRPRIYRGISEFREPNVYLCTNVEGSRFIDLLIDRLIEK